MEKEELSTRDHLLRSALTIMNRSGYGGLSLSALALQSGMTKQRVRYHFTDLDEIVLELGVIWSKTGQQFSVDYLSRTEYEKELKILAIAESLFAWIKSDPELARFALVLYQAAPQIPKLEAFMVQARKVGRDRIKTLLMLNPAWKAAGRSQVETTLTNIHAHLYGYSFYICVTNDLSEADLLRASCLRGLAALLA